MTQKVDRPGIDPNIHPPVIALGHIVAAYLLGWIFPTPIDAPNAIRILGFASIIIGFLLGIGAVVEFRKEHTTLNPHGSVSRLVTGGIYRFTRNPIYLGFLLMVVGLPLNSGVYWGLLVSPFYAAAMSRLVIEKEENYLEDKFKELYTGYKSRVRRWL
jgi:protein-S-isoprenylcysteine O-methyltransferase Ste14